MDLGVFDDVSRLRGREDIAVATDEVRRYKRLDGRKHWAGADGAWMHASHLLVVKTRWLREQYTRLYWHDIQAIALYSMRGPTPIGRALEAGCLLIYAGYAVVSGNRIVMACAALFLLLYGVARWRMKRFAYAVYTRVNVAHVPAGASKFTSMGGLVALENAVRSAQGEAALDENAGLAVGPATMVKPQMRVWVHALFFAVVLVIYSAALILNDLQKPAVIGLGISALLVLLPLLMITLVLQRDFEFPASIRVFAWFFQIGLFVEVLHALSSIWIPVKLAPGKADRTLHAVSALLPALCGLLMVYRERLNRQGRREDITTLDLQ